MRTILFILNSFVALSATLLGLLMMVYPLGSAFGVTFDLLRPTFLTGLFIPGAVLTLVGTINMAAVFSGMQNGENQYNFSLAGGIAVSLLIIAELILIPVFYWLQFVFLIIGVLIVLLSYQLKGKWVA